MPTLKTMSTLKTIQIGMSWLPERMGGLNRVYYDCIHHLPPVGVEVQGLVTGSPQVFENSAHLVQSFAANEASLLHRWYGAHTLLKRSLAQQSDALIVSHFALYTFAGLSTLRDRPLVTHFQGPWALESSLEQARQKIINIKFRRWIEQSCYNRSQKFIVLSEAFRQVLHREYGIPLERIHIIPPGVEMQRFNPSLSQQQARTQLGWPQDRPIILAVRRLAKRMGLENLIAAIDKVRQIHPDVLLLIAGKGDQHAALQAQIQELHLEHHVKLLGFMPDEHLPLAYRSANFSVVPTVALEGFGLIVIECLAAGTPVLGTPVDAIPETLRPLSDDLVFASSSVQHMAEGIVEALSGTRHLPSAEDCQSYIAKKYAWPVVAQQIKQVYQSALSQGI
jgi:glycosyltransferase involved in cell wall biosynthesis